MSQNSKIEWTDATWNPVTGCTRVSAGCDNCYAVKQTHRMDKIGQSKKYGGLTVLNPRGDRHFNGVVKCHEDALLIPIRRKTPTTYFVNSMSDLFHKDVPDHFIDRVFRIIHDCPQHIFQILTKRPERMAEYTSSYRMAKGFVPEVGWPLRNAWLGTSCEDQQTADERIPHLLKCSAAVRFLSIEPLLAPIELRKWHGVAIYGHNGNPCCTEKMGYHRLGEGMDGHDPVENKIHWVIVGGESGPSARPMHPDWAKSIRDQCVAAGVPFFFKQFGKYGTAIFDISTRKPVFRLFKDKQQWINKARTWVNGGVCIDLRGKVLKCGGDFDSAQFPVAIVHALGKKAAGRLLDGREWNEMPSPAVVSANVP